MKNNNMQMKSIEKLTPIRILNILNEERLIVEKGKFEGDQMIVVEKYNFFHLKSNQKKKIISEQIIRKQNIY